MHIDGGKRTGMRDMGGERRTGMGGKRHGLEKRDKCRERLELKRKEQKRDTEIYERRFWDEGHRREERR